MKGGTVKVNGKLFHETYWYTRDKSRQGVQYWKCQRRPCKGRVTERDGKFELSAAQHTCDGDEGLGVLKGEGKSSGPLKSKGKKIRREGGESQVVENEVRGMEDSMDGGDDFHMADAELEAEPVLGEKSSAITKKKVGRTAGMALKEDTVKSGERCVVCGDELIVSETQSSSLEIFRKACCYLNIKCSLDWFPRREDSRFYSFCESCSVEITKINELYKQVEEIQSMIFKNVERVEKRIADAEIIDHWMADDASSSSLVRFEGFRKQALINYRNKLKLRREIRVGKKMGQDLVEVEPIKTAHMFASDPGETSRLNTSRKSARLEQLCKGNQEDHFAQPHRMPQAQDLTGEMDNCDDELDRCSMTSEREVKFWHKDSSKLQVDENESNERLRSDIDLSDNIDDMFGDGDIQSNEDNSDPDYTMDEEYTGRKMTKTHGTKNGKSRILRAQNAKKRKIIRRATKAKTRVLVEGVQVTKYSPGACPEKPDSEAYSCCACGKITVCIEEMKEHIQELHLGVSGMFRCHICDKLLAESSSIPVHIKTQHEERTAIICEICGRPLYCQESSVKFHMWTHLSSEEKKDPQYKDYRPQKQRNRDKPKDPLSYLLPSYQCSQCGQTFQQPKALKKHELNHLKEQPIFQCQDCGIILKNKKCLNKHIKKFCRANDNKKTYPCPKCTLRFRTPATRSKHLQNHDMITPFSCPKCRRRFENKSGLKNHIRMCKSSLRMNKSADCQKVEGEPSVFHLPNITTNLEYTTSTLSQVTYSDQAENQGENSINSTSELTFLH